MTKITVLMNKYTKKLIPFTYGIYGEIIVETTEEIDEDDLIVSLIDADYIDWDNNIILDEPKHDKMEVHPFNLFLTEKGN